MASVACCELVDQLLCASLHTTKPSNHSNRGRVGHTLAIPECIEEWRVWRHWGGHKWALGWQSGISNVKLKWLTIMFAICMQLSLVQTLGQMWLVRNCCGLCRVFWELRPGAVVALQTDIQTYIHTFYGFLWASPVVSIISRIISRMMCWSLP